jgi:hypothetical protein
MDMRIAKKRLMEVIEVFHNSAEEMRETVQKLQAEGWSGNTRLSVAGVPLSRLRLDRDRVEIFKRRYPDVTIHEDKPGLLSDGVYVYFTIHEREIEEDRVE